MSNSIPSHTAHCGRMNDPLLTRAQLAIQESRTLRTQGRALQAEQIRVRDKLRLTILESAMYRSEAKAYRDNREKSDCE